MSESQKFKLVADFAVDILDEHETTCDISMQLLLVVSSHHRMHAIGLRRKHNIILSLFEFHIERNYLTRIVVNFHGYSIDFIIGRSRRAKLTTDKIITQKTKRKSTNCSVF